MKILKAIILIAALLLLPYFLFSYFMSSQMSSSKKDTWDAMKNHEFKCPEGTEEITDDWSKLGYSRSCVPLKHGKWEAWSEGYKNIDGYYDHGKQDGKWTWYYKDGSIYRIIEYSQGKEISNKLFEKEK